MKYCCHCKKIKKKSDFYSDKRTSDKLRSWCKRCILDGNKDRTKKWYEERKINNSKEYKKYQKEYQRKRRLKLGIKPRIKRIDIGFSKATIGRYGYDNLKRLKENSEWVCSWCGSVDDLTIHHKDNHGVNHWKKKEYSKMNNSADNLELVCRKCHGAYHTRQKLGRDVNIKKIKVKYWRRGRQSFRVPVIIY